MIDISLPEIASVRHKLHVFMVFCLMGTFLSVYIPFILDNLKKGGKR
jgi:hypothetical protein